MRLYNTSTISDIMDMIDTIIREMPKHIRLFAVDLYLEKIKDLGKIDNFYNLQEENQGISVVIKLGGKERFVGVY